MPTKKRITRAKTAKISIEDIIEEYLDEKRALNKAPATIKNAEYTLKEKWLVFLTENGFELYVEDIDDEYTLGFSKYCLENGMKPVTLNHYIRDIRAFIYWCMDKEYLKKRFKVKTAECQQEAIETYTKEELKALMEKPRKKDSFVEWRSWAIIQWILATGHRASTVCEIRLEDINYRKAEIIVRKTKNKKAMITPLSAALAVAIKEYIRMWRADAREDDYLFPSQTNEKLTVNALKHGITRFNRARGVEKIGVHAFRHTFASEWVRNSGDSLRLQKLLGHSTLEMTRRYVNLFAEDLKEGFDTYNPLDNMKKGSKREQVVKRTS